MATKPVQEEKATKLMWTISNDTSRLHTHGNRGGGRMQKTVLVPIFNTETLDKSIQTQICDLFINQLVKVALSSLDDKNTENPSN